MAVLTVNGIVTRHADYRDSDRMLTLLTLEHGLIGAAARGCRRPNSPLITASEVFTYGEFVLSERAGRYTVTSCQVRESFYPLRQDVDRLAAAYHVLELINAGAEGANGEGLLRLAYYALSYLAYTPQHPADAAICFTFKCLAALGYTPAITMCACCGEDMRGLGRMGFSPELGGAVCGGCMRSETLPVSPLALEAVRRMLLLGPEEVKKVALPPKARRELFEAAGRYAEYVLERRLKAVWQLGAALDE